MSGITETGITWFSLLKCVICILLITQFCAHFEVIKTSDTSLGKIVVFLLFEIPLLFAIVYMLWR